MSGSRSRETKPSGSTALGKVASLISRSPRLILGAWLVLVAVLALKGLGLEKKLTPEPILIPGSATERAYEIAVREFGREDTLVVMLRGPRTALERQGRLLAARLDAMPRVRVTTPWDRRGGIDGLNPSPDVAALVVSRKRLPKEGLTDMLPPVRKQIDATVTAPVEASMAGGPPIFESIRGAMEHAAAVGERIAIPVLLVVLLLVFRSVLAAALPVVIGGAVVAASRGVLDILLGFIHIEATALVAAGMMGLALGVDYSLLIVSRFREELRAGGDVNQAVHTTVTVTGRTVIPAGCGLLLAMLVATQLLPGSFVFSMAIAAMVASVLSVLSAVLVVPAMLSVLGVNLDRWSLPQRRGGKGLALRWSNRVTKHPRLVVWPIVFLLLALATQAFALDSSVATVALLPPGDRGRQEQEEVQRDLGEGWVAPIEILMDGQGRPVTTAARLRALAEFQRRIERDPGVEAVAGFSELERSTRQLATVDDSLARQRKGLERLGHGIAKVRNGARQEANGISKAAGGAGQLDSALEASHAGAGLLAEGLVSASDGSARLAGGLARSSTGSGRIAEGTEKASGAAARLAKGLDRARDRTGQIITSAGVLEDAMHTGDRRLEAVKEPIQSTQERLAAARQALLGMTTGSTDPEFAAALRAVEDASGAISGVDPKTEESVGSLEGGIKGEVDRAQGQFSVGIYLSERMAASGERASDGVEKLARGSRSLDRGLGRLEEGSRRISGGITRLAKGGQALAPGLVRLSDGAQHLSGGLAQVGDGANGLAGGLGGGAQQSKLLAGALGKIDSGLERQQDEGSGFSKLEQRSPGLFKSGYFYLASLDGSNPEVRSQAGSMVSLDQGGRAARMLVIPSSGSPNDEARATRDRLEEDADDLARETGSEVVVGGFMPDQLDIDADLRAQAPLTRLGLALVTFLVLLPVVRSLLLPILAALLNMLTVGATFGLMSILFDGSLLGGPGYVDSTVIPATIMVIYALAIDYEVFVFARMREEYDRTGSPSAAVTNGLGHTAHVVSGAAVIMIAVFLAFSVSSYATIRNFGVAQAIGVFIDAFIIRLVLIPTLMRALGHWSWWIPGWLDRLLPGGKGRPAAEQRGEALA